MWKVVQHFALLLQNQHMLIHTDNKAAAAYKNRQGGVCSAQLLSIATWLLHWVCTHLLSIRAVYMPGELNRGVDIMSRGGPHQGDWTLHPEMIIRFWQSGSGSICGTRKCAVRSLVLECVRKPSAGSGRVCTPAMGSPTSPIDPSVFRMSAGIAALSNPDSPRVTWFPCLQRLVSGFPWELVAGRRSLSGRGGDQQLPDDRPASVGLATERDRLEKLGLSRDVVRTIQSARAASTRASYTAKRTALRGMNPLAI